MRVYATFDGIKDLEPDKYEEYSGNLQMIWKNLRNDAGEEMDGEFHSNRAKVFTKHQLRSGNRYVIECGSIVDNKILYPKSISHTFKNPKCGLIRKVSGDYTFIKGKFRGKWISKLSILEKEEMNRYLLWLGKNTNNEATVINVLNILKILSDEK